MNINYVKFATLALSLNSVMTSVVNANEQPENVERSDNKQAIIQTLNPQNNIATKDSSIELTIEDVSKAKRILMDKLATLAHFSGNFTQEVRSESGDLLEQSSGQLAISKPNLANWHTSEPDELEIVSDGQDVWFYNPWIEQVSVYSLSAAIAQTPILLLTSKDEALWQGYSVTHNGSDKFVIIAKDVNSQIKSLTLAFDSSKEGSKLQQFSFLDATGQLSHIKLSDFDDHNAPEASLFKFVVPEGVQIDDQRAN
jgi:outer membrane lipoprotein carrier protein